jgi:hypothetical protein
MMIVLLVVLNSVGGRGVEDIMDWVGVISKPTFDSVILISLYWYAAGIYRSCIMQRRVAN